MIKKCTKTAKEHAQVGKIHMGINGVFKEMLEKVKKPLYNNTATVVNDRGLSGAQAFSIR